MDKYTILAVGEGGEALVGEAVDGGKHAKIGFRPLSTLKTRG